MSYQIDIIKQARAPRNSASTSLGKWEAKNNLYHLLAKQCSHPAYFWFNYKWAVPVEGDSNERISLNTPDAIDAGWGFEVLKAFLDVNPQAWVDAN